MSDFKIGDHVRTARLDWGDRDYDEGIVINVDLYGRCRVEWYLEDPYTNWERPSDLAPNPVRKVK